MHALLLAVCASRVAFRQAGYGPRGICEIKSEAIRRHRCATPKTDENITGIQNESTGASLFLSPSSCLSLGVRLPFESPPCFLVLSFCFLRAWELVVTRGVWTAACLSLSLSLPLSPSSHSLRACPVVFWRALLSHPWRVLDPEQADLFYVPIYPVLSLKLEREWGNPSQGRTKEEQIDHARYGMRGAMTDHTYSQGPSNWCKDGRVHVGTHCNEPMSTIGTGDL